MCLALPCDGDNMVYKPAMSACPRTCLNKDEDDVECELPDVEGCECAEGTVLSGTDCVPVDKCGCMKDAMYYAVSVAVFR